MTSKKKRIIHSPEFKVAALKLAEKVGVAAATRQLGLHESHIYGWCKVVKKDTSTSQREKDLAAEVAKRKGNWLKTMAAIMSKPLPPV